MTLTLTWLLAACVVGTPVERNCLHRQAFYPDPDGDGLGDPSEVFIGCEAPDGWVSLLAGPDDSGTLPPDTSDTGSPPVPTGDTAALQTGDTARDTATGGSGGGTTGATGATGATGSTGDTGS